MRLFSRVQPDELEVDQKSSSLRRRSDEAFLSCAAADEAGSGSEKLFSQMPQPSGFLPCADADEAGSGSEKLFSQTPQPSGFSLMRRC